MLVLTCHAHVAAIFHEAGAHVRSLSDPNATWGRKAAPPPRIVAKASPAPEPEPQPVAKVPPPSTDLWPAEAFFFGRETGTDGKGVSRSHGQLAAAAKPPRRHASRHRKQRL
jgi:hypothetical protein